MEESLVFMDFMGGMPGGGGGTKPGGGGGKFILTSWMLWREMKLADVSKIANASKLTRNCRTGQ